MKLSVVIPVYNGADFIAKSYASIVDQQLEDFEIIYVDNNSVDASVENIKKIIEKDSKVSLLHQPKQGAAAARNMGIQAAKGVYVYLFDVDDEIYPNALTSMILVLDTYPDVEAVFGKMVKSYKGISETEKPTDESFDVILKETPYWGLHWFSNLKSVVGPPAFLYRSSVFKKIGTYNKDLKLGQDTALDIKLGMTCKVAFLDRYVYLYFKHEASTIQTSKRQMPRAFMIWPRLAKEHLPFYLEHEVPLKFKTLLHAQLYQSMGRQLVFTKGFANRVHLRHTLLSEIKALTVPFIIRFYLCILVLLPFEVVRKFYGFYIVPHVIKQIKN